MSERQAQKFHDLVNPVPTLPPLDVFRCYTDRIRQLPFFCFSMLPMPCSDGRLENVVCWNQRYAPRSWGGCR
jgi:hypothetical protein